MYRIHGALHMVRHTYVHIHTTIHSVSGVFTRHTSHCQLAVFQSLMVPSSEPDASLPSQSVRAFTTSVWSSRERTTLHVSVFHTLIRTWHQEPGKQQGEAHMTR